jgi:hypothetical protein
MFKPAATLTSISLAFGCAAFCLLAGCDTAEQQADQAAKTKVENAQSKYMSVATPRDLDVVQGQFDSAAPAGVSDAMKLIVRGRAAEIRFERVQIMLADLRGKDLEIAQTIKDIEQLALQIAGAQSSIAALKSGDPATQIAELQKRTTEITGGPGQATWTVPGTEVSAPTIAALAAEIQDCNDKIATNKFESTNLKTKSAQLIDQAETLQRKSEAESADQRVADITAAAQARHDAAIGDAQVDTLAAQLAQLQTQAGTAAVRKSAVESSVAAIKSQIDALQGGWTSMQKQVDAQMKLQQGMIGTESGAAPTPAAAADATTNDASPNPSASSINQKAVTLADRARNLAQLVKESTELRATVGTELDRLIADYTAAASQASTIRTALSSKAREKPADPDVPIWKDMMDTLNPGYFRLQEAAATQARASLAASETADDVMIMQMMDGYQVAPADTADTFKINAIAAPTAPLKIGGLTALLVHDRTGVEMPRALGELGTFDVDKLKKMQGDVDDKFKEALDAYENPGPSESSAASTDRKNLATMGHALTNRLWAEYEFMVGDAASAKTHLSAAETDESQVDASFRGASISAAAAARASAASADATAADSGETPATKPAADAPAMGAAPATDAATTVPSTGDATAAPATGDAAAAPATMPAVAPGQ